MSTCAFHLTHPGRSEDRLRPFVKRTGPDSERHPRGPTCSVWRFRRKAEEDRGNRSDRQIGDFSVADTTVAVRIYAAWRV
jgi:hypothetical protein